ncbi:MAG: hypothetical protein WEF86_14500, partial [Gemmatimonadota bacterium]
DLEHAHEQYPLAQGRIPVQEVFVPEVMGVGGAGVNPYITLLLACLRRLPKPAGHEAAAPFWLTADVQRAVEALTKREKPPQLRNLQNLAYKEGVSDRFGSLLTLGVEGHAARLLDLHRLDEGAPGA